MKTTPASQSPRFCSQDGMALADIRVTLSAGFDPFTGLARPTWEHVTRECPTPMHDVWVLTSAADDAIWVKSQPHPKKGK